MPRRPFRAVHAACLILVAAMCGGCAQKGVSTWSFETPQAETMRVSGPAIDVENFHGDVTVRINPNATSVSVRREVRITGDATKEEARILLEDGPCDVELEDRDGMPVLVVRSLSALPEHRRHEASLMIVAPSSGGVRVVNGGGDVLLVGVLGAIHVENKRGPIEVRTNQALVDPIALSTGKGNVLLQAPFASTGALDVDAGSGRAIFEAPDRNARITAHRARREGFTMVYNGGANPVLLRTGDGTAAVLFIENAQSRMRAID